jgi:Flp pilus assembly pilin Flp
MKPLSTFPHRRLQLARQRGQTLVEYALIIAFVAVVAIGVLMATGGSIRGAFNTINVQLATAQQASTGSTPGGR